MNRLLNCANKKNALLVLLDKDVFSNLSRVECLRFKLRITVKAVILNNDNEIAFIGSRNNNIFLLPGGGIEGAESLIEGLKREILEETGCRIKIVKELGITEDFRLKEGKHYVTFGYLAKVVSFSLPKFNNYETSVGAYLKWISVSEALELCYLQEAQVSSGVLNLYNIGFNIYRDSFYINSAINFLDNFNQK